MSRFRPALPERPFLRVLAAGLLVLACRSPAERDAARLAQLRDAAADGIEAADAYCAARSAARLQAERGGPDADALIEQLILAPEALDDYCEARSAHEAGHAPADTT
jgi:hypothetical protein